MSQNSNYLNKKNMLSVSDIEIQESVLNKLTTYTQAWFKYLSELASLCFIVITFYVWRILAITTLCCLAGLALVLAFNFITYTDTWITEQSINLTENNLYENQTFDYIADFEKFGERPWSQRYTINKAFFSGYETLLTTDNFTHQKVTPSSLRIDLKQGEVVLYGTNLALKKLNPNNLNLFYRVTPISQLDYELSSKEVVNNSSNANPTWQQQFLPNESHFLQSLQQVSLNQPSFGTSFLSQCKKTKYQKTPDKIGYNYSYKPAFIVSGAYKTTVETTTKKYGISPNLIYSIMRAESNYRPFAVSKSNALGLMQLIPHAAGAEAHRFLTGIKETPTPDILFDPIKNIEYGVAYVHLLFSRHFYDITNKKSRELCVIAAYNGGPNAVWRSFDSNRELAIDKINSLSSDQVYEHLTTKLATVEARLYVDKILNTKEQTQQAF